jgi:hypothetical protein
MITSVLYTLETKRADYRLPAGSTFIFRLDADEVRAQVDLEWITRSELAPDNVIAIVSESEEDFRFTYPFRLNDEVTPVYIHDDLELTAFLALLDGPIYLDITGLTHRSWASILRAAVSIGRTPTVIYVEPMEYSSIEQPNAARVFNLSERFEEISPLPGFARLSSVSQQSSILIPLLGFEGSRFTRVLDQTEYDSNKTFPVIGLPGYRPEYADYAYKGNRVPLEIDYMHRRVTFAKANCPFDVFDAIARITADTPSDRIKLAPIGTKPHGVGAVLFALSRGTRVELLYDHPKRSRKRSVGAHRMCVFDLPAFVQTDSFKGGRSYQDEELNRWEEFER